MICVCVCVKGVGYSCVCVCACVTSSVWLILNGFVTQGTQAKEKDADKQHTQYSVK